MDRMCVVGRSWSAKELGQMNKLSFLPNKYKPLHYQVSGPSFLPTTPTPPSPVFPFFKLYLGVKPQIIYLNWGSGHLPFRIVNLAQFKDNKEPWSDSSVA